MKGDIHLKEMVEQGDRECDVFHEAFWICSEEMTEHTRKVLYLEKCYRAVCAGERLSQKIQFDFSKAFLAMENAHLMLICVCPGLPWNMQAVLLL